MSGRHYRAAVGGFRAVVHPAQAFAYTYYGFGGDGPAVGNGNHGSVRWTCPNVGPVFGTVFCKQNKLNEKIKFNFRTQYCCCTSVRVLCGAVRGDTSRGNRGKQKYDRYNQCGGFRSRSSAARVVIRTPSVTPGRLRWPYSFGRFFRVCSTADTAMAYISKC